MRDIKKYPRLKGIDDNGVNVDNIFDWLEEQQKTYGEKFTLNPINLIDMELDNSNFVYE